MSEAIHLDKHLVALIQCSRGEAQKYIEGGWVLVDGEVIDQPQFKILEQKVELHTDANLTAVLPRTMLLNLPEGFDVSSPTAPLQLITPETHMQDDRSGIRVLKRHFARLTPTTPIESGATGLMVFFKMEKSYVNWWKMQKPMSRNTVLMLAERLSLTV